MVEKFEYTFYLTVHHLEISFLISEQLDNPTNSVRLSQNYDHNIPTTWAIFVKRA